MLRTTLSKICSIHIGEPYALEYVPTDKYYPIFGGGASPEGFTHVYNVPKQTTLIN